MHEKILILDFGSQYTQLIARRIRELNVYSEIVPYSKIPVIDDSIKGIILSGSPFSCRDENAPRVEIEKLLNQKPVLGICYGAQLMAQMLGGNVSPSSKREYGRAVLQKISSSEKLLGKISARSQVWMSHADTITTLPEYFEVIASTDSVEIAAFKSNNHFAFPVYGVQFHPEVVHTTEGKNLLAAFVKEVCGCKGDWTPASFVQETVDGLKKKIGSEQVVLGLSGGVDSTVTAILISKAIGKNLHCIFVDNGLLRKNEFQSVLDSYQHMGLNVTGVNASKEFLDALHEVSDPETKRKIIGKTFIDVFDREAHRIQNVKFLGQGTIYPDVIESISVHGPSQTIKSHHNVGGLPDFLKLDVVEPLRFLFKDEVRKVGAELKIDPNILNRHPFPGPGLSIRILGAVSEDKLRILRDADEIFISNLKKYDQYDKVWQAATILLPIQSVGVMGDERTYEFTCVLRAVTSVDGMTADWSRLPDDFLAITSSEIINQVKGINRVVYDISSKPPATIEWE